MNNVVLIGFMGSGKSSVGRHLAAHLQRPLIDLDHEIEAIAGRPIQQIFESEGEAGFRERERKALQKAIRRDHAIIATGGGAPLQEDNWQIMRHGNTVVGLTAEPAELVRRMNGGEGRPLLTPDVPTAISLLLPERLSRYRCADLLVATDRSSAQEVARGIAAALPDAGLHRVPIDLPPAGDVRRFHEVTIGRNLGGIIVSTVQKLRPSAKVLLVTDQRIGDQHGQPLLAALKTAQISASLHVVPAGEKAKSLEVLAQIYEALSGAGIDRDGLIIALGGGTVGDIAGFVAATWMRGVRWLQVPTTLLAMVDSSIGGKTGINLPAGKNMAGAVHQPLGIFTDLQYLATLPADEYRASLAEILKAAVIADRSFTRWLLENMPALTAREPDSTLLAIKRAIEIKVEVVRQDPDETGVRAILNYGHTVGHALERASGYGTLRHGEAVAWGMQVAARISVLTERLDEESASLQRRLLEEAGLLRARPAVHHPDLLEAMRHDKKSRNGRPRWVLLRGLGDAEYGCDVSSETVDLALRQVLGA